MEAAAAQSVYWYTGSLEERCAVPGLHLDFDKKKRAAQVRGLYTEEGLQVMMKKRNYYPTDTVV